MVSFTGVQRASHMLPQSHARRGRTMSRPLILLLITQLARTAVVSETPSLTVRLEKLFEKLESFTISPPESLSEKIAAKIEKLNSLNLETVPTENLLTDEDEEVLSAMQEWGGMSEEEVGGMAKELQMIMMETDEKSEKLLDSEYSDDGWNEDDLQYYAMDEDWDADDDLLTEVDGTSRPELGAVTPSSMVRLDTIFRSTAYMTADPVTATNERPRILDDSALTASERFSLSRSAVTNMKSVLQGRCFTPQPRWLSVRQLAPAADIVYMPPCVQLHRCAADSGCCYNESEICAPVEGRHVILPFYLHRASGANHPARLLFYNHTRCACVPRDSLSRLPTRLQTRQIERDRDMQAEWQVPTQEPKLDDDEATAPTQMRRCTCPTLFRAKILEDSCSCGCEWPDLAKRRDCLSLSRGREHFGIRDRVCIANGDCNLPICEYGNYGRNNGRCPQRKFKRRYVRRYQDRPV